MATCKECHHRPSMRVAEHGAECQCACHDIADASPELLAACELSWTALTHYQHGMVISGVPELLCRIDSAIAATKPR